MAAVATQSLPFLTPVGVSPIRLAEEARADAPAHEALLDEAFGRSRFAKTSEILRIGRAPSPGLALVAKRDGALVGTVRLWNVRAGGVAALLLGPLAVAKSCRGHGVGGALMREAIARADAFGHDAILLVGDEPYYRRFGFQAGPTVRLALPGPVDAERFLALELRQGVLADAQGMVVATGAKAPRALPRSLARAA
jgi:predicted N-acetyltransferase YhbS